MLHESSTSLRGTIFELSSPILYELGIEAALRTLCEQLTTRHGFACHITRIGETGHLLDATRAVLYQCSREILMNIAKHAKASNAWITIEVTTAIVRIEITDDGVGIDPGQQSSGIGLLYVEERMSNIGGYLAIEPAKSGGLRCQLIVNLE
jgi:signal transduction histidine kinase